MTIDKSKFLDVTKKFGQNLIFGLIPLLIFWHLIKLIFNIDDVTIPWPHQVISAILENGIYLSIETFQSWKSAIIAFFTSMILGLVLGIQTQKSQIFSRLFVPSIIVTQILPKAAMIPLLVIILGYNELPKIIVAVLIGFFPIYSATIQTLNQLPNDWKLFFKTSAIAFFRYIELPYLITNLMVSIKTSLIYVIIGIVTAEVISPNNGIGSIISFSFNENNAKILYAAIFFSCAMGGLSLYIFEIVIHYIFPFRKWKINTMYRS